MTSQQQSILFRYYLNQRVKIADLESQLNRYKYSHLGILSGPAIRDALMNLEGSWDIIAIDIRKMHQLNEALTWSGANLHLIAPLVQTRRADGRPVDVAGQWAGDEVVFAVPAGDGRGFVRRLLSAAQTLTDSLSDAQRVYLRQQTGGLVDGLCVALVCVEGVDADYLSSTEKALDLANTLKEGTTTGERATSGARGTVVRFIGDDALRGMQIAAR
jgi:hypothetical protein